MDINNVGSMPASSGKTIAEPGYNDDSSEDEFDALRAKAALSAPDSEESADEDEDNEEWDIESFDGVEGTVEEMDDQALLSVLPGAFCETQLSCHALKIYAGSESCTMEEATQFRLQLRSIGPAEFCRLTVESGAITAKKLLTAFGIKPPVSMEGEPDESYYQLLSLAISRELSKRIKLTQYNSIDDAVELIKRSRNIIVLTGAGISTSLGIPDFRSKDIGLYSKLEHLGLQDPQEVFDITLFKTDPSIFYSIARDILPEGDKYTPTHKFIYLLQQKGKLLTNYSQNIDNIESIAGILPEKLIQCHGSFATASCVQCRYQIPMDPQSSIYKDIKQGLIPKCDRCIAKLRSLKVPGAMKRKRSQNGQDKKRRKFDPEAEDTSSDDDYENPAAGVMKPDITFFGEPLPDTFSDRLTNHDKHRVDLVIVIGTSLKVAPVSEVVPYLPAHIPQMYISRTPVGHVNFDIDMLGDCDVVVAELCRRAGWDLAHEMVPEGQVVDIELEPGFPSRHVFKERKLEKK
jgi:NAD-dependent histone deacetylase SIR2